MSRAEAMVSACERLLDALCDDLLQASDAEILASHTPAAARVAAHGLRQHLRRTGPDAALASVPHESRGAAPPDRSEQPEEKP